MKQFFVLLKVSLQSILLSATNSRGRSRKKAATGLGAVFIIAFLGLYLSGLYSYMLMKALAPWNMEVMVFIFMGMVALMGGVVFTSFAVKGVVFGGKDNDLLLSMPVSTTTLMVSRITAIYLENLLFSVFVLVPAGVICTFMTHSGVGHSLMFWIRLGIGAVALPLLDTALAVLLGAMAAFLSARVSRGALGQNLIIGIFMAFMFYFSFYLNDVLKNLADNAAGVKRSLTWASLMLWLGEGIMGDWGRLLTFVLCCTIPFVLVVVGFGRVYRQAVTAFAVQDVQNNYKLSPQSASGQKKALMKKELQRFFGTPMYFWNAGIGLIMLLAMGAASLIMREKLMIYVEMFGDILPLLPMSAAMILFLLCICPIDAPSVSLEGKYLWILRESPVEEGSLIWVKVGFQLLLTVPCAVIAGVCISVALGFDWWQGVMLLMTVLFFAIGHAAFGMIMGLCFPKLDAVNETVVIKQSMATVLTMFGSMAVVGAAAVIYYWGSRINQWTGLSLSIALFVLFAAVCTMILARRGTVMLRKL